MSSAADKSDGIPIELPDLGSGDAPVRLVQWLVDVGSEVIEGERLAEVLADGVLFHVAAPASGLLTGIEISRDVELRCGDTLGHIDRE